MTTEHARALATAEQWNRTHPVGTPVASKHDAIVGRTMAPAFSSIVGEEILATVIVDRPSGPQWIPLRDLTPAPPQTPRLGAVFAKVETSFGVATDKATSDAILPKEPVRDFHPIIIEGRKVIGGEIRFPPKDPRVGASMTVEAFHAEAGTFRWTGIMPELQADGSAILRCPPEIAIKIG